MSERPNRPQPNPGPGCPVEGGACSCECQALMKKLSAAQFAAFELHLLLDTHPCDPSILAEYRKYERMAQMLREEYEQKCGPLRPSDQFGDGRWEWVDAPWPWDICKEGQ